MDEWRMLGEGTFNKVYINSNNLLVLKIHKHSTTEDPKQKPLAIDQLDEPERAVRLWNEINPNLKPKAYCSGKTKYGVGWICPYVWGRQATDLEIPNALIDIFNNTGRIITDAAVKDNFKTTNKGEVTLIDIGMALELEKRENVIIHQLNQVPLKRSRSEKSLNAWNEVYTGYNKEFFRDSALKYPHTTQTIKALLFIKANRPDVVNVEFLKTNKSLITHLAQAYDAQNLCNEAFASLDKNKSEKYTVEVPILVTDAMKKLEAEAQANLARIKSSCALILKRYILSRGSLSSDGVFSPSFITSLFRNKNLTKEKAQATIRLISAIKQAKSCAEVEKLLYDAQLANYAYNTNFTSSGLNTSICKCQLMHLKMSKKVSDENKEALASQQTL